MDAATCSRIICSSLILLSLAGAQAAVAQNPPPTNPSRGGAAQDPRTRVQIDRPVPAPERGLLEDLTSIGQLVAAVAAAVGLWFLVQQVGITKRQFLGDRTRRFQEAYLDPAFYAAVTRTLAFLNADDAWDCLDKIKALHRRTHAGENCLPRTPKTTEDAPKASVQDVELVLGFYEDLGATYNREDIDQELIARTFGVPPVQVFTWGWWYVCWSRDGRLAGEGGEGTWSELEQMCKDLRTKDEELREFGHRPAVRFLCVPASANYSTSDVQWERARLLSYGLSATGEELTEVFSRLKRDSPELLATGAEANPRWELIVVPAEIERQPDESWQAERATAAEVKDWLSAATNEGRIDRVLASLSQQAGLSGEVRQRLEDGLKSLSRPT